jgi:hypothetical protein
MQYARTQEPNAERVEAYIKEQMEEIENKRDNPEEDVVRGNEEVFKKANNEAQLKEKEI